ncbi:MAG TPA: hypothetical protein VKV17_16435, partial [Bryobacteraceae bacterium]|nr:hypothetical protein [Bryobacteraceae bacterium]
MEKWKEDYSSGAAGRRSSRDLRIIQCKMSMKQGWGSDRFPMQGEHENGGQVGMLRLGAGVHAECREP